MALFDFTKPAAQRSSRPQTPEASSSSAAAAPFLSTTELNETTESLNQLRLALDFATARQALTRKHLSQAQVRRDRGYQQSQFANRTESNVLRQRAQRHEQDNNEAIQQLITQLTAQAEQIASLEERILTIQDQLAQIEGFTAAPPSSPCSALMPPGLMERFTGQIEL